MSERRSLTEGLKATPPSLGNAKEKAFVYGEVANATATIAPVTLARTPLSTRIRADFVAAIKRASLERQLSGEAPQTITDILEQAIEPWLRANGYLR